MLLGLLVAGCAASGGKATSAQGPGVAVGDEAWGPITMAERSGQSLQVLTSLRRLRQEVARSFAAMEWAVLRLEGGEVGADAPDLLDAAGTNPPPAVCAWALLADGRTATVVGRVTQRGEGTDAIGGVNYLLTVYARVGRFGDSPLERRYLDELAAKIQGKPQRQRIFFILPSP